MEGMTMTREEVERGINGYTQREYFAALKRELVLGICIGVLIGGGAAVAIAGILQMIGGA